MSLKEFFSSEYLFKTPTYHSKLYIPLIVIFALMIIFAILFKLLAKKSKASFAADILLKPFITGALLGYLYLFARYESLPWLSTRFFLLLILVVTLAWAFSLLIIAALAFPKVVKERTAEERYRKYLPKKRK